jgi:hypothetical protein
MTSDQTHQHEEHHSKEFLMEKDICSELEGARSEFKKARSELKFKEEFKEELNADVKKWCEAHEHGDLDLVYGHDELIGGAKGYYTCDTIVDEWFRWFLTTPASSNPFTNPGDSYQVNNAFLMNKNGTRVYFATTSPFREPADFKTITITEQVPLLIPVYNMSASKEDFPSLKNDDGRLTALILKDLCCVDTLNATFDGDPIHGCCVIRCQAREFPIADKGNVIELPDDRIDNRPVSTIHMCHGGFWLLMREKFLDAGDHLLKFTSKSRNYEMNANILINALV